MSFITKEKSELIAQFEKLLEGVESKLTLAALCSEIAIQHSETKGLNLAQPDVSGSLQDRLFKLANDFAVAKQGEVAVKLHSIHNGLQ